MNVPCRRCAKRSESCSLLEDTPSGALSFASQRPTVSSAGDNISLADAHTRLQSSFTDSSPQLEAVNNALTASTNVNYRCALSLLTPHSRLEDPRANDPAMLLDNQSIPVEPSGDNPNAARTSNPWGPLTSFGDWGLDGCLLANPALQRQWPMNSSGFDTIAGDIWGSNEVCRLVRIMLQVLTSTVLRPIPPGLELGHYPVRRDCFSQSRGRRVVESRQ